MQRASEYETGLEGRVDSALRLQILSGTKQAPLQAESQDVGSPGI